MRAERSPNLGMQTVLLEQGEGLFMCVPKRKELDAVLFVLPNLFFERRHMLRSPIVSDTAQSETPDHGRALGGSAIVCVERYDTPCDEMVIAKVARRGGKIA